MPKPHDHRMADSPILQPTLSHSSFVNSSTTDAHLDHLDELPHHGVSSEARSIVEEATSVGSCITRSNSYPQRIQLEEDVKRLQRQLQEEVEMHAMLQDAIEKDHVKFSLPPCIQNRAQELLYNIALLEITISKLEEEILSLHFQLDQERNERRLVEYCLGTSASKSLSTSFPETMNTVNYMLLHEKEVSVKKDAPARATEINILPKVMPLKGLWEQPNLLSEEMVRCMRNIFISLADSSKPSKSLVLESQSSPGTPLGHLSNSSWLSSSERTRISSWVQSPQVDIRSNSEVLAMENVFDPYKVHGKLSWADIGKYALATEVSWMSVGKKQLEYASDALKRFRILVEQLAKVNPVHLKCNAKLAFWINLYNALIMHAYLAYGVPRNDLKFFSLMQKAAYTIGGHSYSAATIEYAMLKMKPPRHRPQIALLLALHKLKVTEEQWKSAISTHEPLVAFALSCGTYSSPVVRIYTAENVRVELEEAQHDFIRASVGVSSKGKLLVPKMVQCFAKAIGGNSDLAVCLSRYLLPEQAAFIERCMSQRRQSFLVSRNCDILPFDSRFRYLFQPNRD